MLNSQNLIDKICDKINCGGLTSLETCQTNGALNILSNPVVSVTTCANLPSATEYVGRMIYVDDENRYYYAFANQWFSKFDSNPFIYAYVAYGWGGYPGNGTSINTSSPVSVVGGFTDWCQFSKGGYFNIGLRSNGTVWTWGEGSTGKLGNDASVNCFSPVSVVGGYTDWCQVGAGQLHGLAVRTNGTAWAWGDNTAGKLGDATTIPRSSPVSVVGGFTDWCQVSGACSHSLGVRTNGTAWAWGNNARGQLGDATTIPRSSPVSVVGGFTDWCGVSGGLYHSVGIRANGTIWSWGCNGFEGRLGDGTTINRTSPVSVVGGFTDWCQISNHAGSCHTMAIRTNGTLWGWGYNGFGQLGDNTTFARSSPVSVIGGFTDWCQVSSGRLNTLAIRQNGTLWAWGWNGAGQLGDGTTISRRSPVSVVGGIIGWCHVSAGGQSGTAIASQTKGF